MIKTSEMDSASQLTLEDMLMISQLINDKDFKSFKVTLEVLKKFLGEITVVDVGVNLNTLTAPGFYILQGGTTMQESYNLNYPSGLNPGSKVLMAVSAESDSWAMIVQTYFYAKLTSNPCPYSRGKSGNNAWDVWTQPVSQSVFDRQAVVQLNMSQNETELHTVGSGQASSVWSFIAPTEADNTPAVKTSPTKKPGVKLNLRIPNTRSIIGTYKGNTFIADQDGRFFCNVDTTQVSDQDNPKGVDWVEFLSVKMKDIKALSHCRSGDPVSVAYAVNRIIDLLRDIHAILSTDPTVETVSFVDFTNNGTIKIGENGGINLEVTPADFNKDLYIRSSDPTILKVTGSEEESNYSIMLVDNMQENDGVYHASYSAAFSSVSTGKITLEVSSTTDFSNIVASMEVTVSTAE